MDCTVRLHKLGLLPPAVLLMEAEDPEAAKARIPRPSANNRNASSGSLISRAFNRCAPLCWVFVVCSHSAVTCYAPRLS